MWKLWILIAGLTVAFIGLTVYFRRTVAKKNRSIVRLIREQERLEKLLEKSIRKNIMLNNRLKSARAGHTPPVIASILHPVIARFFFFGTEKTEAIQTKQQKFRASKGREQEKQNKKIKNSKS